MDAINEMVNNINDKSVDDGANACAAINCVADEQEILLRQKKMQVVMKESGVDAALLTGNANLLYATGAVCDGVLFLPSCGDAWLFLKQASRAYAPNVARISRPEMIPQILGDRNIDAPRRIALEEDEISHREWMRLSKLFPSAEIVKASIARTARAVKTPFEVGIFRADAALHSSIYKKIPELYRVGMTDLELCASIEHQMRIHGDTGIFRTFGNKMEGAMGGLLAGDNALAPSPYDFAIGGAGLGDFFPMGANGEVLKEGTSVLVDLTGKYHGYMIDFSRTYSIGKLPQRAYDLHAISIEIFHEMANMGKPGVACCELYERAQAIVSKYNVQDCFMGMEKQARFVGHGVGIEINELPVIASGFATPLQENMVIALEPKFVMKGVGAVGIENICLVTGNGMEVLTEFEENVIELN